ncbi:hypothetical protein LTR53_007905 [Teratosphaeriaceae sp. CCFEE 6253]|nr:hypothetical protein LTR53_007905 [Teratosphaeriaceae sp. CCFEE 6253]
MALDQQRNWDVSMAENLERVLQISHATRTSQPRDTSTTIATTSSPSLCAAEWTTPPIYLPDEILLAILTHVAFSSHRRVAQTTLASCTLLSHQWFRAATPLLYAHPHLYGHNFAPFAAAICPSINLHVRPSPLAELVKTLNMASMVHQINRTATARLLGRTKGNLEEFVAPQASFAINCLPALGKCRKLRVLDLSLVSESPPLPDLFKTLARLDDLRTLRLPRSAGFGAHHKASALVEIWPPQLAHLSLSGGIDAHFLHGVVAFPQTLRSLTIEHCPLAKGYALVHLLRTAVRPLQNLESLKIRHMPRLSSRALDDVLFLLPQLKELSVSVDYITPAMFDEGHFNHLIDSPPIVGIQNLRPGCSASDDAPLMSLQQHALETLELTSSGNTGLEDKISPIDILIAIDEGSLPRLRCVRTARSLRWQSGGVVQEAEALGDVLREKGRNEWAEEAGVRGEVCGMEVEGGVLGEEERPWEVGRGWSVVDG